MQVAQGFKQSNYGTNPDFIVSTVYEKVEDVYDVIVSVSALFWVFGFVTTPILI